jgi:hypothetical protein
VKELTEKPAINILKETFTNMLSKVQLGRSHVDDSEDDDCHARYKASNRKDKKTLDKTQTGI